MPRKNTKKFIICKTSEEDDEVDDHLFSTLDVEEELHLLEMEKEAIENFTHDHFLENLEVMKAKRKSALQ